MQKEFETLPMKLNYFGIFRKCDIIFLNLSYYFLLQEILSITLKFKWLDNNKSKKEPGIVCVQYKLNKEIHLCTENVCFVYERVIRPVKAFE